MTVYQIINNIIAGGLLGSLGQGVRIIVGLKKLNEENSTKNADNKEAVEFSANRLILSIFVGFIAGAIGILIKASLSTNINYKAEAIVAIIAIGYSGADFIEGFFNTYIKKYTSRETTITPPSATK